MLLCSTQSGERILISWWTSASRSGGGRGNDQYGAAMLVYLRGTPGTWRPGNSANIWNSAYFGYPGDRSSLLNIICLFIHFFIHTWLQWVIDNRKRTEKREKEQDKLNLDDEVAWLLWMSKAVHILFGFALLLFAPVHSPSALTLIFILLFRSLCQWWRLKKWTRNERGFVSRPFFLIVLTDREPGTSNKTIYAVPTVTSEN